MNVDGDAVRYTAIIEADMFTRNVLRDFKKKKIQNRNLKGIKRVGNETKRFLGRNYPRDHDLFDLERSSRDLRINRILIKEY